MALQSSIGRANRRLVLVSGRWDPEIAVVDLDLALDRDNWGTDTAVVGRPRVTPDIGGRPGCGLPVSIAAAPELNRIFVVNHAGNASAEDAARMPHGHRGTIAVLDLAKAIDPVSSETSNALVDVIDLGAGGPVGCALTSTGHLFVTSAEGDGTEDGGYRVVVVDARTSCKIAETLLGHTGLPARRESPDGEFGRFPNPNGIVVAEEPGLVFTANGGTNDVSVLSLDAVLAGRGNAELGRVPVSSGPFGLALSADGTLLACADREDARTGREGNRVSLIDVAKAATDPAEACIASLPAGTDRAETPTRPTGVAFSADGTGIYVTGTRSGTLSRLEMEAFRAGIRRERRIDVPCRAPRGVRSVGDGIVAVAGGSRGQPRSGQLSLVRDHDFTLAGLVTGTGHEPYFIEFVDI